MLQSEPSNHGYSTLTTNVCVCLSCSVSCSVSYSVLLLMRTLW